MVAASAFVAALMLTMRAAGPHAAGIVSAFPVMTATLVLTISHTARPQAASNAIGGMLSGLRAYLAFCLAVIPVTALAGALTATAAGLLACAATCRLTVRAIRSSPTTATAG
jgi:uncharacterized membrane protein YdbT with pleckstrin-like domain